MLLYWKFQYAIVYLFIVYVNLLLLVKGHVESGDSDSNYEYVVKQYRAMPYPPFTDNDKHKENQYYNSNNKFPGTTYKAHTLEKNNHYLHQGKENFQ